MKNTNPKWFNFYAPDGRFLCGYTIKGTFAGELAATRKLLAEENGIAVSEIDVKAEATSGK